MIWWALLSGKWKWNATDFLLETSNETASHHRKVRDLQSIGYWIDETGWDMTVVTLPDESKKCSITHPLLVIRWDKVWDCLKKKMQCHTVTHILLVMGWDTMRLPCQKKLLTLCWSWDHGWDIILHGKMCHSPPVGHGMRHGQPCIRRNAVPVTHMLFGMWHDETARWKKNITHILLVFGRDMMRLLAKEKCSVTHPLLVHGMTPWWNCLLS